MTETASVTRILQHIGASAKPPALDPLTWKTFDQNLVLDPLALAPAPAFGSDQTRRHLVAPRRLTLRPL